MRTHRKTTLSISNWMRLIKRKHLNLESIKYVLWKVFPNNHHFGTPSRLVLSFLFLVRLLAKHYYSAWSIIVPEFGKWPRDFEFDFRFFFVKNKSSSVGSRYPLNHHYNRFLMMRTKFPIDWILEWRT